MKYTAKKMGEQDYLIQAVTSKGNKPFCRVQAGGSRVEQIAQMLSAYDDLREMVPMAYGAAFGWADVHTKNPMSAIDAWRQSKIRDIMEVQYPPLKL